MALGSNQAAPRTHCNRSLPVRAQEGAAAFAYSSSRRRSSPFHWLTVMLVIAAYATWRLNWIDVSGTSYTTIFCISLSTSQAELVYVAA